MVKEVTSRDMLTPEKIKKMLHRFSLYIETYYLLDCGVGLIREGNDGNCGNIGTEKIRGIK